MPKSPSANAPRDSSHLQGVVPSSLHCDAIGRRQGRTRVACAGVPTRCEERAPTGLGAVCVCVGRSSGRCLCRTDFWAYRTYFLIGLLPKLTPQSWSRVQTFFARLSLVFWICLWWSFLQLKAFCSQSCQSRSYIILKEESLI